MKEVRRNKAHHSTGIRSASTGAYWLRTRVALLQLSSFVCWKKSTEDLGVLLQGIVCRTGLLEEESEPASRTKLSIVEFGMVKSYHTVNRGGADITDSISKSLSIPFAKAEEKKKEFGLFGDPSDKNLADIIKTHTDYIFSETNNVLIGYEKKYNRTISKVIFTGGGALLKGLKEVAESNFKAEVEMGHPFAKVGAPVFLEKVLEATGPEFAVAIGLALRKLQ
jgi:Tfp pilus assembly PilM family ATPase